MNCPKCDADVTDSWQDDDWSVGISAGWYCDACDLGIGADEGPAYEPQEGDIQISGLGRDLKDIGTPLSEISTQPGPPDDLWHPDHARYANWIRIARSWGYD